MGKGGRKQPIFFPSLIPSKLPYSPTRWRVRNGFSSVTHFHSQKIFIFILVCQWNPQIEFLNSPNGPFRKGVTSKLELELWISYA